MEHDSVSTGTLILELILLVILIGINGFFVAIEFAVVTSRRSRIDQIAYPHSRSAAVVHSWIDDDHSKDRLIAASQLGITIASLALGVVGENAFQSLFYKLFSGFEGLSPTLENVIRVLPFALSLIIVSGLHVIFGEQIPKVAALRKPETHARTIALPMEWFRTVTGPFNRLLDAVANGVLRILGLEHTGGHSMLYSVEELKQIVTESEESGLIKVAERDILNAVFDFRNLVTRQVMVPRTEVVMVEADAPISELIQVADTLPYSKFPVYERDTDHILGVIYVKDLIKVLANHREDATLRGLIREAIFVPETLPVDQLLAHFRVQRQHIAIALDEYGGTAGIVTLEDVLEELVGEVQDEFEKDEMPEILHLTDGSHLVSGLTLITAINDEFDLNITDENYDTIAGYVMGRLERIPVIGDMVVIGKWSIRVDSMDGLRIDRLKLLPAAAAPPPDAV